MSRRRRNRKHEGPGPDSPPQPSSSGATRSAAPAPAPGRTDPGSKNASVQVLRGEFERAADMTKTEWSATRKCRPMAYFVYPEDSRGEIEGAPTVKKVALAWKDDFQKELIRQRIRDKAVKEKTSAVIVLMDERTKRLGRSSNSLDGKGTVFISGAARAGTASASVSYTFEEKTGLLNFGALKWLDNPERNYFLDGIYADSEK